MDIILLERMKKLGDLGDEVKVANGFARNYLIPHGKAVRANKENRAMFESRRQEFEQQASSAREAAKSRATTLEDLSVVIRSRASQEGKLYGSVGTREIAEALTGAGVEVSNSEVVLNEGALRETGKYTVQLQLHPEVVINIDIEIEAEAT